MASLYRLAEDVARGRHLIATCDIPLGEVVLSESPLLVWENPKKDSTVGIFNYVVAFLALPSAQQQQVLDMKYPELLTTPRMARYIPVAEELHKNPKCSSLSVEQIHTLIAVAESNCHQYYGTGSLAELKAKPTTAKAALFYLGSKVNHSCRPNLQYSSQNSDGHLKYKAICDIKEGDELTFSYIGELFSTMSAQRRATLKAEKNFDCHCERCDEPDYCRPLPCTECNEGFLFLNGLTSAWACTSSSCSCTAPSQDTIQRERMLYQKGNILQDQQNPQCEPSDALALFNETAKALSYTHFLTIRCATILTNSCAAHIVYLKNPAKSKLRPDAAVLSSLHALAAWALLSRAALTERVSAKCVECKARSCSHSHPPLYEESTADVYFAAQYYIQLPLVSRDRTKMFIVKRYLPLINHVYGENVSVVKSINDMVEDTIERHKRMCDECGKEGIEDLKLCSRCKVCVYCSKECQVKGWQIHKIECCK
jgi:hypothetical protein